MKIKKLLAALCAGAAVQAAMGMSTEPGPSPGTPATTLSTLRADFDKASRQPAPSRSLYTPESESFARELLTDADIVIFGELHHSTNYKFLADNPAFFREAASRGAKNIYIELPVIWKPVTDAYFSGEISAADFEREIRENFSTVLMTAETPSDDYATQFLALCKTARQAGMRVLPTDFRVLSNTPGTSDILGIPDIMRRDDAVRSHTMTVLHQYERETGQKRPITVKDFYRFNMLYFSMLEKLSSEEGRIYMIALHDRQMGWNNEDHSDNFTAFQNELQARYSAMTDKPGDKILFIGGSRHVVSRDSIGDLARRNGHTRIAAVELLSQSGLLWRSGVEPPEIRSLYTATRAFSYRIETDNGRIIPLLALPVQIKQAARTFPAFP